MARRIRVAGVPADLRVPRGWPAPTDRWIRTNAFWVPPADWTPMPGVRPAPANWTFWVPNRLWEQTREAVYRPLRVWNRVVIAGVALSILLRVWVAMTVPPTGVTTLIWVVWLLAMIIGFVGYITHRRRLTQRALARHAILAAEGRTQRLTREYQRYLVDVE